MTCYEDQDTLLERDVADLWEQGLWPPRSCKFCGQALLSDRLPTTAVRVFGHERAQQEMARCHALGMCFKCGMSP